MSLLQRRQQRFATNPLAVLEVAVAVTEQLMSPLNVTFVVVLTLVVVEILRLVLTLVCVTVPPLCAWVATA